MNLDIASSAALIHKVCLNAVRKDYLLNLRTSSKNNGMAQAVAAHDTARLVEWLTEVFSFQGVSDALAIRYMDNHGRLSAVQVQLALDNGPSCSRLASYAAFEGCRYAKTARTCAEPEHFARCPLPTHDLRNGRLNQVAYALVLFARDVCRDDLVSWIDHQLAEADTTDSDDRALMLRAALLEPLDRIHGVSFKVLSMALADLLLGAGSSRERWTAVGASMVAVDTLVHNWLARTGILQRLGGEHPYGPACYRAGGCAAILHACAQHIDARQFCTEGPRVFPRLIQHGIWSFCAEGGLDICNGNRIDDRFGCDQVWCPVFPECERVPLRAVRYVRDGAT